MTDRQEDVSHFIRLIRGISPQYMRYSCTHGACHRFYLILKDRFPTAVPYDTVYKGGGHVVSKIFGKYWDIYGEHDPTVHGAVEKYTKRGLERMSSCIFDESYVLLNTDVIAEWDTYKKEP